VRIGKPVGPCHILDERNKPVHVLSGRDACALALILSAKLLLLCHGRSPVAPEDPNCLSGLALVIR
jgi:hypothetical protein